jgi:ornithine cyclodeaminase/alanine dehydrogenase-like protein (mu-crystallin family)
MTMQRVSDLLDSRPPVPRPHRTVFESVGVAHADLAVARQLFERNGPGI